MTELFPRSFTRVSSKLGVAVTDHTGHRTDAGTTPTVLVVDDQPELTSLYATWLSGPFVVRTANDGTEALERLDDAVDVVLLDRRIPGFSGDDLLVEIRERGFDVPVAMITAVEPDVDIIAMGFDEYVLKPLGRDDLHSVVRSLLARSAYDATLTEFYALASKRAALLDTHSAEELADSAAYADLLDRLADLETRLDANLSTFTRDDYHTAFRALGTD